MKKDDVFWMQKALALAEQAAGNQEVPVGAVVVIDDEIVGQGCNAPIGSCDPTAHAEVLAIRDACERVGNYRLPEATLYVTIEPCTMCTGAIVHARLKRVVFGAIEPKAGAVVSQNQLLDHPAMNTSVEVTQGVLAEESSRLISSFFALRREKKKALKQAAKS
ncbi:tRNA-specific adenosine deaminase [Oleiphilus sp. HI0009]|uniref:tRNA adenosine(34) deaminase TadA n=1 Tax=unclassified Oleiphilus TaxID=2631174 RepID=UPI0007C3A310|nr:MULTISPECIES: tRNA adenosine(34) deaminase TadA [unclassified Oleiphilus]KZX75347.1 tRNA-specific adenosine deaminase [Oleiphilus sp. HI0009]MCH2157242.1 tRNA adenosine(34) deaminase TadA [Oleiphilaceae bacterium]KZX82274.1 tRNA-specific adenosine deaminase [Oleiphilus sp. HI0009]KZY66706.1 tRNA-specific adenosine deaminase [Oleiphilus sp. HI0066]KZY73098.1 tRNA-specific adenosine deaminase [Oleiphilus sp. HI0067]